MSIKNINIAKLKEFIKNRKWHVAVAGVLIIALIATLILTTIVARSRDNTNNVIDSGARPDDGQGDEGNNQGEDNNKDNIPSPTQTSTPEPTPTATPTSTRTPIPTTPAPTPSPSPTIEWDGELIRFRDLGRTRWGYWDNFQLQDGEHLARQMHLVRSREEMVSVYRTFSYYSSGQRHVPEYNPNARFNNAYFANNSIIMFTFNTDYTIDQVVLRGNRLIVYKTKTLWVMIDIAQFYILVEVDNTRLRNVHSLALYNRRNIGGASHIIYDHEDYRLRHEVNIR